MLDTRSIEVFNVNGPQGSVAQRWEKWVKSLNFFMVASAITDKKQKRAMLLHLAGPDVQDIFETLRWFVPQDKMFTDLHDFDIC